MSPDIIDLPVRKSIVVRASLADAFLVFTEEVDAWWPRTHHIGKSPMQRVRIEGRVDGRCYTEQVDGSECDWGSILVWDPPHRLVMSWQVTPAWSYEPDPARSSEVEVRFTRLAGGAVRVDLEHRFLARHGPGSETMRGSVAGPNGWSGMLQLYAARLATRLPPPDPDSSS